MLLSAIQAPLPTPTQQSSTNPNCEDCHDKLFTMDIEDDDDFYAPEEPMVPAKDNEAATKTQAPAAGSRNDDELEEGEEEDEGGIIVEEDDEDSVGSTVALSFTRTRDANELARMSTLSSKIRTAKKQPLLSKLSRLQQLPPPTKRRPSSVAFQSSHNEQTIAVQRHQEHPPAHRVGRDFVETRPREG